MNALEYEVVSSPDECLSLLFTKYQDYSWVVLNLEQKDSLERSRLESAGIVSGDLVLRASDLWHNFMVQLNPSWNVISPYAMEIFAYGWLSARSMDANNANLFLRKFKEYLPLLTNEHMSVILDWANNQEDKNIINDIKVAQSFLEHIREKKIYVKDWGIYFIYNTNKEVIVDQKFVFYLGAGLTRIELQMLEHLAFRNKVVVLAPSPIWTNLYQGALTSYASSKSYDIEKNIDYEKLYLGKFESPLEEVIQCVEKIKHLIQVGILSEEIVISAPKIENYWPLLRDLLSEREIRFSKPTMSKFKSLSTVQSLLKNMKSMAVIGTESVEKSEDLYEREKRNFYHQPDFPDYSWRSKGDEWSGKEFLTYFLDKSKAIPLEVTQKISEIILEDNVIEINAPVGVWANYLTRICQFTERKIYDRPYGGVNIVNITGADCFDAKVLFILGCSQQDLRGGEPAINMPLSFSKVESDLGIPSVQQQSRKEEFHLDWLLSKKHITKYLFRAEKNIKGDPQISPYLWMSLEQKEVKDFENVSFVYPDTEISSEVSTDVSISHLSASSLKQYVDCPFKFYVSKNLNIKMNNFYNFDFDPLEQGQIMHKAIEELYRDFPKLNMGEEAITKKYDDLLDKIPVDDMYLNFWRLKRDLHIKILTHFFREEAAWTKSFPKLEVFHEVPFEGYFGVADYELLFQKVDFKGAYRIKGVIDRIEVNGDKIIIIDYKYKKNAFLKSFKSWRSEAQFQLPIYKMAIESGLSPLDVKGEVIGLQYYFLESLERSNGYLIKEEKEAAVVSDKVRASRQWVAAATVDEELEKMNLDISKLLLNIKESRFHPLPKNEEDCVHCHVRPQCRARHLL